MKLRLMPVLTGAVVLAVAATPLVVTAAPITSGQQLLAQVGQRRQGPFANLNLTQEQKNRLQQLRQDTQREIEGVLTPQQLDEYNAAKQIRQGMRRGGGGNWSASSQGGQNRRSNIWDSLNLSSNQKSRIQEIRQRSRDRMMSILTDQQRQQLQQRGRSMMNQNQY